MNTSTLKSFAPAVRHQLMEAVERKLDVVLAAESADYRTTYARQVKSLAKLAASNREGLVERVAYTWFNRLAALRYLDARGWHPFRSRVLTAASPDETQPEILRRMRTGALPDDLARHTDPARLGGLLDGSIPSGNPQGEVYRHLVLAACRYYHALLPDLFERLDDETELLLPDDLLTEQSVVEGFRTEITDEDCAEVEVLGWLYQFYISEKKDEVMGRKKAVPSEDIPAVTQLFTPHWIVRYLVENSLGRLWLLNRPGSALRDQMPYYVEGEAETDFLQVATPQEIRLIDPAVGSGHMLTYAFDLLYAIYEEEGYAPSEIPGLILTHNLYGVDIDQRAAQLASLALVLKARERARRFFSADALVRPHVIALQDVKFSERELDDYVRALDLGSLFDGPVRALLGQFEHATTFGSLIQPVLGEADIHQLRERIEARGVGGELFLNETHQKVLRVLGQAEYLTQRYQVAVVNPPYMGGGSADPLLKGFLESVFPESKSDLSAVFIEAITSLCKPSGLVSMVTMHSWMFLDSYLGVRKLLLEESLVVTMAHLGIGAFETMNSKVVQTTAFCFFNEMSGEHNRPVYFRLVEGKEGEKQRSLRHRENRFASLTQDSFKSIPGMPVAYWATPQVMSTFAESPSVDDFFFSDGLTKTGNNDRYLRKWWEVEKSKSGDPNTYRICVKGGKVRKFFGNTNNIVDWSPSARSHYRSDRVARITPEYLWEAQGISWTKVTSARPSFRWFGNGIIAETGGPAIFAKSDSESKYLAGLGLLSSKVGQHLIPMLNPTLNMQTSDVLRLPLPDGVGREVDSVVSRCIDISQSEWNNSEVSQGFLDLPLLRTSIRGRTFGETWNAWARHCEGLIGQMQQLETENNRLWIEAFGLRHELSPEVPEDQITLARADKRDDVAAFLSYAVGCMMGRYSLDKPGLILADAGATVEDYLDKVGLPPEALTFAPDDDGIVPVLDGEWFEDDVVARTRDFLRATFGEDTLRENLRFIEEALGRDLRSYFLRDFYTDHLKTYKKRPIYWLVQSPKKGFGALVYLHRYTRDTLNLVLNRYLREYQAKLRDRIAHLARVQADDTVPTRERTDARKEHDQLVKTLHECEEWERETVLPLAQARIELDLDDGVKANYPKLGKALATVRGLS